MLNKLCVSYYPDPDSHLRKKVKLVKEELHHATGVNTSDLTAKKDCIALKAEVDKLDNAKLINIPTTLNNLETLLETSLNNFDIG